MNMINRWNRAVPGLKWFFWKFSIGYELMICFYNLPLKAVTWNATGLLTEAAINNPFWEWSWDPHFYIWNLKDRMRSQRKEHDSSFCLEVQKLLLLLLQKHRGWTSWFSIPGYHRWQNYFPVKLLFHKFHVPLRASQGTMMIPESNWVSLPPLAWGLATSLAISSGQVKHRGFCHVLQVRW